MNNFFEQWIKDFNENVLDGNASNIIAMMDNTKFENKFKDVSSLEQIRQPIQYNLKTKLSPQFKNQKMISLLTDFISNFFIYKAKFHRNEFIDAFTSLSDSFSNFGEFYQTTQNIELSPIVKYLIRNLYQTVIKTKDEKKISDCGRTLISFFSKFQTSDENKMTVLYCVVVLMKIYFKLKTYRNSITLVTWFDKSNMSDEDLPQSENATFSFYQGRLALYELKISDARDVLTRAFELCINNVSPSAKHNAKIIYEYLVPINLFFGIYPKKTEIEIDSNYFNLSKSVYEGDLGLFSSSLDELEDRMISFGTVLIAGKLKPFVLRNLIRNIHISQEEELEKMKAPVIKLEQILNVIKNVYKYEEIDIEELELSVIGVLYRGLIGGYVHHGNKVIVFGKKNPFPDLREVMKNNYSKII